MVKMVNSVIFLNHNLKIENVILSKRMEKKKVIHMRQSTCEFKIKSF